MANDVDFAIAALRAASIRVVDGDPERDEQMPYIVAYGSAGRRRTDRLTGERTYREYELHLKAIGQTAQSVRITLDRAADVLSKRPAAGDSRRSWFPEDQATQSARRDEDVADRVVFHGDSFYRLAST